MGSRSHAQNKTSQQPTSAATQNLVRSRPFAIPAQPETSQPEVPDLQTQLENAQRFGHSFSKIAASKPAIIQPKLTIGAPGDKYEQEADRVAQQVVQRLNAPKLERSQTQPSVQRETMPEEDELQMKPLTAQIQRVELLEEDELQMQPDSLQRETMPEEEEELQMTPMLQRQASEGAVAATTELESAIQQSRGSGQPLAERIRQPMEHAFGNVDFSRVNVHTDARSDQLNQSIQAKAFTTGQDIFFRQGAYQPGSRGGQELIAHELTHVIQQNDGAVSHRKEDGHAVPARESDANQLGHNSTLSRASDQDTTYVAHNRGNITVQRNGVKSGQDPLTNLKDPKEKGLVYGASNTRKKTSQRLYFQDVQEGLEGQRYRTIDSYNDAIGLSGEMDGNRAAVSIFNVREALLEKNVVDNWGKHIKTLVDVTTDPDLIEWIKMLKENYYKVSLYDLGNPRKSRKDYKQALERRKNTIESKDRLGKNFKDYVQWFDAKIDHNDILEWLSADRTHDEAQSEFQQLEAEQKAALSKWVRTAFFRRTSKFGIDFTVKRKQMIHFNISGDPTYAPGTSRMPTIREGGMKEAPELKYGRPITTSEYRHLKKGMEKGTIDKQYVNQYDEF